MNPSGIEFLTSRLDKSIVGPLIKKMLPFIEGLTLMNEIPLALTSKDIEKVEANRNMLLKAIEDFGYIKSRINAINQHTYEFFSKHEERSVTLDLDNALAFTAYMEGGIPIVIIGDVHGNGIMVYKNDILSFRFRDDVRPIRNKVQLINEDTES